MRMVKSSLVVMIAVIATMFAVTGRVRADDDFKSVYTMGGTVTMGKEKIPKVVVIQCAINVFYPNTGDVVGIGMLEAGNLLIIPQGLWVHLTLDVTNLHIRNIQFSMPTERGYQQILKQLDMPAGKSQEFLSGKLLGKAVEQGGAYWYKAKDDPESSRWHLFFNTADCPIGALSITADVNHKDDKDYARILFISYSHRKDSDFGQPYRIEVGYTPSDLMTMSPYEVYLQLKRGGFHYPWAESDYQRMKKEYEGEQDATDARNDSLRIENERLKKDLEERNNAPISNLVPSPPAPAFVPALVVAQATQVIEKPRQREAPIAGGDRQIPAVRVVALQAKVNGRLMQSNNVVLQNNTDRVDFYLTVNDPDIISSRIVVTRLDNGGVIYDKTQAIEDVPREFSITGKALSQVIGVPFRADIVVGGNTGKTWTYTITRRER